MICHIHLLPCEILMHIFRYNKPTIDHLPNNDIWNYSNVCRRWRDISTYESHELRPYLKPLREVSRQTLLRHMSVSGDVRGGGTGKEFKDNLFSDGSEAWNKWYDVSGFPSWIEFRLPTGIDIAAYSMRSANDCDRRDPYLWYLEGRCERNESYLVLHCGDEIVFEERFQWKSFHLDNRSHKLNKMKDVRVSIHKCKVSRDGTQLAQLMLFETHPSYA